MKKIIGHYEILKKIGEGGMGVVYKARDIHLDRFLAIKILHSEKFPDPTARERFLREAKTASALNHPNIVTIYEVDSSGGVDLIAMEYVEGKSLERLVQTGGLPVAEVLQYAVQIADGVSKAHAADIIHRDLKPANIMVRPDGLVKILDFGLAKRVAPVLADSDSTKGASLTQPGAVVGTVSYMSPEQALGESVDPRSDVFSFGVILYEMLSGKRPFSGANALSTLQKIHIEQPPALRLSRPDIPQALDESIQKALEKSRDQRFQTMDEFRRELQAVLDELTAPRWLRIRAAKRKLAALFRGGRRIAWRYAGVAVLVVFAAFLVVRFRAPSPPADPSTLPASAMSAFDWATYGRRYLEQYYDPENVDRAIGMYKKSVERDPNYALAHAGLAEAYYQKNASTPDPQWVRLSGESARKAVELNPDLAAAHLARGIALFRTPDSDQALREFERASELDPRSARASMWLAEYYFNKGDTARADELFMAALQFSPNDWMTNQFYGRLLYRQARYEDAIARWERSRQLAPDNVLIHRNLGAAYHMLDKYEEAATAFQRALEIIPNAGAYSNLGTVRFFQGRYEEAAATFEKAVEINPTNYLYWGNLGDAHRWVPGHEDNARQAFVRAIALSQERIQSAPDDPELTSSLSVYFAKSGDKESALETLSNLNRLPKRTPGSYFKALIAYEIVGKREEALRALEAALRAGYALKEIKNEPELTSLRTDRRYHTIVAANPQ